MPGTPFCLRPRREAVAALLASLLSVSPAAAQSPDTSPSGMVAFFMATSAFCPQGWSIATVAQGRLIVGVTNGSAVGTVVGTALTSQPGTGNTTAPSHQHNYAASVSVSSRNIEAHHCCNNQGAQSGTYSVSGSTDTDASNLPLMQLVVCQKQ